MRGCQCQTSWKSSGKLADLARNLEVCRGRAVGFLHRLPGGHVLLACLVDEVGVPERFFDIRYVRKLPVDFGL
jgi:hypothetical protein